MPLDGGPERHETIEALDAYWESLLVGAIPPDRADEHDGGLKIAVERLYAIDDTPGADTAFVRELEGRLMDRVPRSSPAGLAGVVPVPTDRWWQRPKRQSDRQPEPRRRSIGSLAATALLLLITLSAGVVAIRWDGKESGPTDSYVISPPAGSPTAAECDVPPRTAPPAPLDGTPVPPPIAASRVLQDTRLWLEQAELPTGEPASAEEVAGIIATIRELSACEARATDPGAAIDTVQDSRARQFALFTDDYLRRHLDPVQEPSPGPGTPTPPWWGAYWYSAAWSPGPEMPEIQEVLRLPNGRIGALVDSGRFGDRDFLVFVHVGDRWLIDEVAMVAPGVTTAGTPSIEERARSGPALALIMDDISFAPSRFGIPPNMDVALTLANVGKVPHTFNVDYLDIHLEVQPGEATTIVIKASTGTYDFYCSIPGHKEAGMVGSMFVAPAYQLPGSSGGAGDGDAGTLEVFGGSVVEGESATPNP